MILGIILSRNAASVKTWPAPGICLAGSFIWRVLLLAKGIYTSWLSTVDWLRPWNGPVKITYEGAYQFFAGKPQQPQQQPNQPPAQPPGGPPLKPSPEFGK